MVTSGKTVQRTCEVTQPRTSISWRANAIEASSSSPVNAPPTVHAWLCGAGVPDTAAVTSETGSASAEEGLNEEKTTKIARI